MKLLLKRFLSYFPSNLPVGMAEFENWSNSIIELTGPLADTDSLKFVLASQIQHLSSNKSAVPKHYFVQTIRKAAANQISAAVFQSIKLKQQAAAEAAKAAAEVTAATTTAEATATPVASNVTSQPKV